MSADGRDDSLDRTGQADRRIRLKPGRYAADEPRVDFSVQRVEPVALQRLHDHRTGEDADDLKAWLHTLEGCPTVEVTALASCGNESHGSERPTWFYVEADGAAGVARRRCLACGAVHHLLDSQQHWPSGVHTASCPTCAQSMFEVAAGLHTASSPESDQPVVTWMALGVRCVTCGRVDGLTDMFVPSLSIAEVVASI